MARVPRITDPGTQVRPRPPGVRSPAAPIAAFGGAQAETTLGTGKSVQEFGNIVAQGAASLKRRQDSTERIDNFDLYRKKAGELTIAEQ